MKPVKCIIVGDNGVGKASIIKTYIDGEFSKDLDPVIFDNYQLYPKIEGKQYHISAWYANGSDAYACLRPLAYPGSRIVLICFSVDDQQSFRNVRLHWREEIRNHSPQSSIILVGTKVELRDIEFHFDESGHEEKPQYISYQEGLSMATEIGAIKYMEVSSRYNQGLGLLVKEVIKESRVTKFVDERNQNCKGCVLN